MAGPAGYEAEDYSTERADTSSRLEAWTEHVRGNHGRLDLRAGSAAFAGRTQVQRAEGLQIVRFQSDPVAYRRTARAVSDGDDTIRVLMPTRGPLAVEVDDQRSVLAPGHAAVVSMASPFAVSHGASTAATVLSLPAEAWPRRLDPHAPRVLDLSGGPGVLVASMIGELVRHRHELDAPAFTSTVELLIGLLARSVREPGGGLYDIAADYVDGHSDDPALTPARLAERLGWSLRSLQLATRARGQTPAGLIREARVARARARLRDPAWQDRSVVAIAHASGFGSLSAFYDAFGRDGDVPSRWRDR